MFKSDRSFLDKLSMGAKGVIKAKSLLTDHGHQLIELERYSTSNKIWRTKVKRLRVPDLLCLKCGRRIEVRAKSKLTVTMSDSPGNPDRQWDAGLRNNDLVVFIACRKEPGTGHWVPSPIANAFYIRDLRKTVDRSRLGRPKSAAEGAERDRTWPCYSPGFDGEVQYVEPEFITMVKRGGRKWTYNLKQKEYNCYVLPGKKFEAGTAICAGVLPDRADLDCNAGSPYGFLPDLMDSNRETVYCAVKALGWMPRLAAKSIPLLIEVAGNNSDEFIKLEAMGALARLGNPIGWNGIATQLQQKQADLRMEAVLILGELGTPVSRSLLLDVADNPANDPELRAAAVWGLGLHTYDNPLPAIVKFLSDPEHIVAAHAITALCPHINDQTLPILLQHIGPPGISPAVVCAIKAGHYHNIDRIVDFLIRKSDGRQRPWLLYLLGLLGEEVCAPILHKYGEEGKRITGELQLIWKQHVQNWTNDFEFVDLLEYTMAQDIREST